MFFLQPHSEFLAVRSLSQYDRELQALFPDSLSLWEKDRQHFIQYLRGMAQGIAMYGQDLRHSGSWGQFIEPQELIVLFDVVDWNLSGTYQAFREKVDQWQRKSKGPFQYENPLWVEVLEAAKVLFEWWIKVENLSQRADGMTQQIHALNSLGNAIFQSSNRGTWPQKLGKTPPVEFFRLVQSLYEAIVQLKEWASEKIEELMHSGEVEPFIGIFLGFKEILDFAGENLQDFGERHLTYYYKEVLKMQTKARRPAQVHLVFQLAQNSNRSHLPKGLRFLADVSPDGKDAVFELQETLQLNQSQLRRMLVLVHDHNLPQYPPFEEALFETQAYFINSGPAPEDSSASLPAWISAYTPGFALASNILLLDNVPSTLQFTFELHHPNDAALKALEQILVDQGNQLFSVSYPTAEVLWHQVPARQCNFALRHILPNFLNLEIAIELGPDDPEVSPCMDSAYAEAFEQEKAIFRFALLPNQNPSFQWLTNLELRKAEIEVKVRGQQSLILQNDEGVLDPSTPFEPFSSQPKTGSSFYVGHPTLFDYQLNALSLDLEWFNLNKIGASFGTYYKGYAAVPMFAPSNENVESPPPTPPGQSPIHNQSFKASISVLTGRQWSPQVDKQDLDLFCQKASGKQAGDLPETKVHVVVKLDKLDLSSRPTQQPLEQYGPETAKGFLRLELTAPAMAFGHQIYPHVLTQATYANMRQLQGTGSGSETAGEKKELFIPREPFTPVLKSVSLNYQSSVELLPAKGSTKVDLYHLHPFGVRSMNSFFEQERITLLPYYKKGVHLYQGFSDFAADSQSTFFFKIRSGASLDYKHNTHTSRWSFRKDGNWNAMQQEHFLSDGTNGLTQSGLLSLKLEENLRMQASVLPADFSWLHLWSSGGAAFLDNLEGIWLHAGLAKLVIDPADSPRPQLPANLPAESISATLMPLTGLQTVFQPYPSQGGRLPENEAAMRIRVSERLRHKQRAISIWDIQAIVLEEFRELREVNCLRPPLRFGPYQPGNIQLVVVPQLKPAYRESGTMPRLAPDQLQAIQSYVHSLSSRFLKVQAVNPQLEELAVDTQVQLAAGCEDREFYIELLNRELREWMSPWYYLPGSRASTANKISSSQVIRFLQTREYVDAVFEFVMVQFRNGEMYDICSNPGENRVFSPSRPDAILRSVKQHSLRPPDAERKAGIGGMAVGNDMRVRIPPSPSQQGVGHGTVSLDLGVAQNQAAENPEFQIKIKL